MCLCLLLGNLGVFCRGILCWLSLLKTGLWGFGQALFDLEATNAELKAELRDLYITGAREIELQAANRKAIIIHVS